MIDIDTDPRSPLYRCPECGDFADDDREVLPSLSYAQLEAWRRSYNLPSRPEVVLPDCPPF